jgi:DNA repair photolyase
MEKCNCQESESGRKITSGTREWADYNVNCIAGCFNDCRYCYAKVMAKRFGRATEKTWKKMHVRPDSVKKNYPKKNGRIMFPSSHDIFPQPEIEEACFTVLSNLLHNGNDILLTTKPRLNIIEKIDAKFSNFQDKLQFRFTITSKDDKLLKFWEPNAPLFLERFECLKYSFAKGYKTSVSIEPFLDYDPCYLVEQLIPFCTESVWIGKMNYIPRRNLNKDEEQYYNEVRRNYECPHLKEVYYRLRDTPKIRFKDSILMALYS